MPENVTWMVGVSSFVVMFEMAARVGGSFTSTMVSVKLVLTVDPLPSLTLRVISVLPETLATGVMVTLRSAPAPPKMIFAFGTKAVFAELPPTVRLPAAVSTSPTVNDNGPVAVSSLMERLGMPLRVGASFAAPVEGVFSLVALSVTVAEFVSVGASLTAVMLIVAVSLPERVPPVPVLPRYWR